MNETSQELRAKYPEFGMPICCENGCGAVIELIDGYTSDKRGENGENLIICQCCAAEEGHRDEGDEDHDEGPVCRHKPKKQLKNRGD